MSSFESSRAQGDARPHGRGRITMLELEIERIEWIRGRKNLGWIAAFCASLLSSTGASFIQSPLLCFLFSNHLLFSCLRYGSHQAEAEAARRARSSLTPVLDRQPAYTAELAFVGGDKHETPSQRTSGDQRIVGTDRAPLLLQRCPQRSRRARVLDFVGQNGNSSKQGTHHGREPSRALCVEREAELHFHRRDARHRDVLRWCYFDSIKRARITTSEIA